MNDRKQENALAVGVTKQNESYVSDFRYAVQISVYLLKPIGAWPLANNETSKLKIILHTVSMAMGTFLMFFFTVVPWIIQIWKEKLGVVLIIRTLCPLLFTITISVRYGLLLWHQERIRSCVDHVADDWRCVIIAEDRDIMLANARVGRTFGIISVVFMYGCGTLYYALPIVTLNLVNENNVTVRLHPSPCEFLMFDSKASPAYEIVYSIQLVTGYAAYSAFCGICSLMANFVTHVCGQCDILTAIFEETVDGGERNSGSTEERLTTAITKHLRLLRLASDVSRLFTEICLVEFVNASCNICLVGYYIITDMNDNGSFIQISMYFFGLASIVFNVFIYCYIGDLLKECCQQVDIACYAIDWYRMPPKKAIELLMPIAMSRYPVTLTAGKMMPMTLTTFSDILKTSMAYFNLLREFSARDVMRT
ncbi:PREDICTED: odorant receptor 45b-like isoform X2 [Vollenhovia emeryi]|uniref:odorant receptor 45b-like isoform X2 n=1 Tax=Vollenhovia emeryi TaxID=411798 RepID=UPI0005F41B34|nr:PREDICTED: odorant receptor 45b-like isoform X2 [Vollenhovia emeryi]